VPNICFDGKERRNFVEERDKTNIFYYMNCNLLPDLGKDCHDVLEK